MKKIKVITYLTFRGNWEEAINTYIKAFGGEIFYMSRGLRKHAVKRPNYMHTL